MTPGPFRSCAPGFGLPQPVPGFNWYVASVAAIVWWAANPGTLVSQVAFAAVLIGGLTTVLMNLNPLIPLDGYYALSDYLEVPNLRQRAGRHVSWLIKTRVFRQELPEPPADEREQRIFLIYGILAAGYITLILAFCAVNTYGWLSRTLGSIGTLIFAGMVLLALRRQLLAWKDSLAAVFHKLTARLRSRPGSVAPAGRCRRGAHPWMSDPLAHHRLRPVHGLERSIAPPDSTGQWDGRAGQCS